MSVLSLTGAKNAKDGGARTFPKSETCFSISSRIVSVIKQAWPRKTSAHVSYLTGVSERAVKYWLAGETRMSVEHVAALLKTDEGFAILKAIMGDAQPEWWLDMMVAAELRESRKVQRAEAKRTERLKALRAQRELFEDQ